MKTKNANQEYQNTVNELSPNSPIIKDCIRAFAVGGFICVIGQFISNTLINMGYNKDVSSMTTSILLIFLSAVLTGLGLYEKIGKFAGAGSVVPITGFANSIVAPAIEFKKEGFIFGVGSKMFVIAGPVLLYGTISSFVVGIIYYLLNYRS